MFDTSRNPAIYAGLLAAMLGTPSSAAALSPEALLPSADVPYAQFLMGCIVGAVASSCVHLAAAGIARARRRARGEAEEDVPVVRQAMAQGVQDSAGAVQAPPERPVAASRARHMAVRDWEQSGNIRVQDVPAAEPAAAPATRAAAPARPAPTGATSDLTDVAESYVRRKTLASRMATRASGVANVLAERLGGDPLEGLPVIERADGTVGDVGTSWWTDALGSSIRRIEDLGDEHLEPADSSVGALEHASLAAERFDQDAAASRRASYISRNVAEVDVGIYPEHRTVAELDREDVWEQALAAMEERMGPQPDKVFSDAIGTIETIDEPDGLEGSTGFIPFRPHSGHPEIVDTNSYVDYLIGDEFSRNPSDAARKSSRDFLTVIQGGSQRMRPVAAQAKGSYHPRHMAAEPLAKEA